MEFGFLLDNNRFDFGNVEIKPRHDYDAIVDNFYKTAQVSNGWIYPQLERKEPTRSETSKFECKQFDVDGSFFSLKPTHTITLHPDSSEKAKFLILSYGFLHGLYLFPAGYLCINKLAYQKGKLTGVILSRNDYEKGMSSFSSFYDRSCDIDRKQMFSILHWLLVGKTYKYEWDRFDAQYKVLDGLYKISNLPHCPHAYRPVELANKYGVILPEWAKVSKVDSKNISTISRIRNELTHEAQYAGHPIGYAYPDENFDLELVAFNVKLIAGIIGLNTLYLEIEPNNRCVCAWNFT